MIIFVRIMNTFLSGYYQMYNRVYVMRSKHTHTHTHTYIYIYIQAVAHTRGVLDMTPPLSRIIYYIIIGM
jgi:hypothetical protein